MKNRKRQRCPGHLDVEHGVPKIYGKLMEKHGKTWKNLEKNMEKQWKNNGKTWKNSDICFNGFQDAPWPHVQPKP